MQSSPSLLSLRQLVSQYNLAPHKKLGQHFLLDEHIPSQMVLSADIANQVVLEVGPGPGALTRALLASKAAKVIAVELDMRCIEALQSLHEVSAGRLEIVHADALKIDESTFVLPGQRLHVLSNLPYNVGTALLCKWLERPELFSSITVMLQKEVVERLVAEPGSKDYGRLSVLVQWLCEVEQQFEVRPEAFFPPPKVMSAVVRLTIRPKPLYPCGRKRLESITKRAFSQRRKMLRSVLKGVLPDIEVQLAQIGAKPTARAEELSVAQFCQLASSTYMDKAL